MLFKRYSHYLLRYLLSQYLIMKKFLLVYCFCFLFSNLEAYFPPPPLIWPSSSNTRNPGNNGEGYTLGICNLSDDSAVRLMGWKMCEQYCKQKYTGRKAVCGGAFDANCYCLERNFPGGEDVIFPGPVLNRNVSMCNNLPDITSRGKGEQLCRTLCPSIHRDFFGVCVLSGICECNDVKGRHSFRINQNRYLIFIK